MCSLANLWGSAVIILFYLWLVGQRTKYQSHSFPLLVEKKKKASKIAYLGYLLLLEFAMFKSPIPLLTNWGFSLLKIMEVFFFFFFLASPMACRRSHAGAGTHTTAVTWATEVTMLHLQPLGHKGTPIVVLKIRVNLVALFHGMNHQGPGFLPSYSSAIFRIGLLCGTG